MFLKIVTEFNTKHISATEKLVCAQSLACLSSLLKAIEALTPTKKQ